MKRLFKTTYRKLFQSSDSGHHPRRSLKLPVSSGICASTLAVATLIGGGWTKSAEAASFTSIDWSQQDWEQVTNLGVGPAEVQAFESNGVRVIFEISVTGGEIEEIDESNDIEARGGFGLQGGFPTNDTNLNIRFDPESRGDEAQIRVRFEDVATNTPINVEGARIILLDIDRTRHFIFSPKSAAGSRGAGWCRRIANFHIPGGNTGQ